MAAPEDEIGELASLSCSDLAISGKADDWGGRRAQGDWCVLSSQCVAGLVCRSELDFSNRCLPPGKLGEHCWVSSHCAEGLSCHWIFEHEIPGTPTHPGRVCNPHDDEIPHAHQLDGT